MNKRIVITLLHGLPYVLVCLLGFYTSIAVKYLLAFDTVTAMIGASFTFLFALAIVHPMFKQIRKIIDKLKIKNNKKE